MSKDIERTSFAQTSKGANEQVRGATRGAESGDGERATECRGGMLM